MSFRYFTSVSFVRNWRQVRELCINQFGAEHKNTYDPITRRYTDNHGNWSLSDQKDSRNFRVYFRYEKDLVWFMLQAGHLADPVDFW